MSETDSNQIAAAESVGAASMMTSLPSTTDYRGKPTLWPLILISKTVCMYACMYVSK